MADRVGERFGNYRLVKLLGEGGFAEVYLGEHIHLGSLAAVKILTTKLTEDEISTFSNEARIIINLEHPHIVRVLDFGMENTIPYIVMGYAPNGSLRKKYPRSSRLPLSSIVTYVNQITSALYYVHNQKLIHRDIKPENMLIGRNNEILLSDFGIASVAHSSRSLKTEVGSGTINYMSPEQIHGKPRPSSDQYSLGIVVYEWLCGVRPFQGTYWEITTQHLSAPPPSFEKSLSIAPDIEQVVIKALAKDPKQRFANVQEFAFALGRSCSTFTATHLCFNFQRTVLVSARHPTNKYIFYQTIS
jgi:eukaryotic-like serine/threonine-protein kinase